MRQQEAAKRRPDPVPPPVTGAMMVGLAAGARAATGPGANGVHPNKNREP